MTDAAEAQVVAFDCGTPPGRAVVELCEPHPVPTTTAAAAATT